MLKRSAKTILGVWYKEFQDCFSRDKELDRKYTMDEKVVIYLKYGKGLSKDEVAKRTGVGTRTLTRFFNELKRVDMTIPELVPIEQCDFQDTYARITPQEEELFI